MNAPTDDWFFPRDHSRVFDVSSSVDDEDDFFLPVSEKSDDEEDFFLEPAKTVDEVVDDDLFLPVVETSDEDEEDFFLESPQAADEDDDDAAVEYRVPWWVKAVGYAGAFALTLGAGYGLSSQVFSVHDIASGSMEPTLMTGDKVVVDKVSSIDVGDIIVFRDPGNWSNESETGVGPGGKELFIKRAVAGGGQTVHVSEDGVLTIDGCGESWPAKGLPPGDIEVPRGYWFVLGDNTDNSADSRAHGATMFVPEDYVVGTVNIRVSPGFTTDISGENRSKYSDTCAGSSENVSEHTENSVE